MDHFEPDELRRLLEFAQALGCRKFYIFFAAPSKQKDAQSF